MLHFSQYSLKKDHRMDQFLGDRSQGESGHPANDWMGDILNGNPLNFRVFMSLNFAHSFSNHEIFPSPFLVRFSDRKSVKSE
jgi:hypothetical protein